MGRVFSFIEAAAASDATIVIQGESGTGKELVARAIHSLGQRREKPMVTVNCSALPESLLESELFGHVRGAFTGAGKDRKGRFEEADGGTLFLDEIGEITPYIQVKLLRVLQQKEIERVGESLQRKIDIRIIAATNQDLKSMVDAGKFREDLYYRLKVFPILLPPLRSRREDIPLLVSHFVDRGNALTPGRVTGVSRQALDVMMDYPWPGNVRELANAIEHAFVLCSGREIDLLDLPAEIRQAMPGKAGLGRRAPGPLPAVREELSRDLLLDLLRECGWNKAEVARRTGLSRASIWKYMKRWEIPIQAPPGL
jgi:transcriptional regulator with GAF, ATPase, and Fis domain